MARAAKGSTGSDTNLFSLNTRPVMGPPPPLLEAGCGARRRLRKGLPARL